MNRLMLFWDFSLIGACIPRPPLSAPHANLSAVRVHPAKDVHTWLNGWFFL